MNSVKGPQTKEKEGAKAKPIDALFISFSSQSVTYGIYHLRARGKVRTKGETSIWEVRAVEGERVKKYPRQREENRGSECHAKRLWTSYMDAHEGDSLPGWM